MARGDAALGQPERAQRPQRRAGEQQPPAGRSRLFAHLDDLRAPAALPERDRHRQAGDSAADDQDVARVGVTALPGLSWQLSSLQVCLAE
jgi:hypothetical protein